MIRLAVPSRHVQHQATPRHTRDTAPIAIRSGRNRTRNTGVAEVFAHAGPFAKTFGDPSIESTTARSSPRSSVPPEAQTHTSAIPCLARGKTQVPRRTRTAVRTAAKIACACGDGLPPSAFPEFASPGARFRAKRESSSMNDSCPMMISRRRDNPLIPWSASHPAAPAIPSSPFHRSPESSSDTACSRPVRATELPVDVDLFPCPGATR